MFFFKRKRHNTKLKDAAAKPPTELPSRHPNSDQTRKSHSERTAESLFGGPEKYNCVQAILLTFKNRFAVQDADIQSAKTMGYGRVAGGLCGALYAGKILLDDGVKSEKLTREFESKAGSAQCKRILKLKRMTCKECVALAARLIDDDSR